MNEKTKDDRIMELEAINFKLARENKRLKDSLDDVKRTLSAISFDPRKDDEETCKVTLRAKGFSNEEDMDAFREILEAPRFGKGPCERQTLEDLSRTFGVAIEVYSVKPSNRRNGHEGFSEHFFVKDGKVVFEDCTGYECYDCLDSYEDFMQTYGDEIEEELEEEVSEQTWTHCRENDGFVEIGSPSYDWPYLKEEP